MREDQGTQSTIEPVGVSKKRRRGEPESRTLDSFSTRGGESATEGKRERAGERETRKPPNEGRFYNSHA